MNHLDQSEQNIVGSRPMRVEKTDIDIYLRSGLIHEVAAAMKPSLLLCVREIPDEASLAVLGHCGVGVVASSEDDSAAQVDGTGLTTINMLLIINTSHLIITVYRIPSQNCNWMSRSHLSSRWSWDCNYRP